MELEDLVGEHELSGVDVSTEAIKNWYNTEDCEVVRFVLDGVTYKAIENPDDGYRSRCEEIEVSNDKVGNMFPPQKVICSMKPSSRYSENDTIQMFDAVTGELVLEVGTDNTDDYYPYCVMYWNPKGLAINKGH